MALEQFPLRPISLSETWAHLRWQPVPTSICSILHLPLAAGGAGPSVLSNAATAVCGLLAPGLFLQPAPDLLCFLAFSGNVRQAGGFQQVSAGWRLQHIVFTYSADSKSQSLWRWGLCLSVTRATPQQALLVCGHICLTAVSRQSVPVGLVPAKLQGFALQGLLQRGDAWVGSQQMALAFNSPSVLSMDQTLENGFSEKCWTQHNEPGYREWDSAGLI